MQEIEQEFQISFKNEQDQHNVDIEILTQEKVTKQIFYFWFLEKYHFAFCDSY